MFDSGALRSATLACANLDGEGHEGPHFVVVPVEAGEGESGRTLEIPDTLDPRTYQAPYFVRPT